MSQWIFPGDLRAMHPDLDYAYVLSEFHGDARLYRRVSVTRFNVDGGHAQGHDDLPLREEAALREQVERDGYMLVTRTTQDEGLAYFYRRARLHHRPVEPDEPLAPEQQYCKVWFEPSGTLVRLSLLTYDDQGRDEMRYDHLSQQGVMDVRANLVAEGWNWYHTANAVYYYQRPRPTVPAPQQAEAVQARQG